MKVICDIETNRLKDPDKIWVLVAKDVESHELYKLRQTDEIREFINSCETVIGHNFLSFDGPVLRNLIPGIELPDSKILDTLILSRLIYYDNPGGHSLAAWGNRLSFPKYDFTDFGSYSQGMEDRCVQDVELTFKVYELFKPYLTDPSFEEPIQLEHKIQSLCNGITTNGFHFNIEEAKGLLKEIYSSLSTLDESLAKAFPPRTRCIRTVTPRGTKYGTLHKGDFRFMGVDPDLSAFEIGNPFSTFEWIEFNAGSPKQIVERLNEAGWKPTDKTKGHVDLLKTFQGKNSQKNFQPDQEKLDYYKQFGWKVSEENLATLPDTAPEAARSLVHRLILASRAGDLEEWLEAYNPTTGRIHGNLNGLGCWTHRMSHNHPNMANIPAKIEVDERTPAIEAFKAPYNRRLRSLWDTEGGYLVGCDADSIQLRILAHYINDEEFTKALVSGNKADATDPHSVNQRALGGICRSRADAKTFIYAFLMGAGGPRLSEVLGCTRDEADEAKANYLARYPGYAYIRNTQTTIDANRGYFVGIDGRKVAIEDKHRVISGYLQNGEVIVMKRANLIWWDRLLREGVPARQVNFVHDEWQTETVDDLEIATYIGKVQAESIKLIGEQLGLNCPLAGNYNLGRNWYETH